MNKQELQKLRDLPIEGVAERLGLRVTRHTCLCPFHDDHHASLSFCVGKNTYRCFVCGASGGTIDLVMHRLGIGFLEACRWLADANCIILEEYRQQTPVAAPKSFDASRYERFFQRPWLSPEARRFLFDERKIDERVVRWCRLTSWRDKNGVNWLQTPYYDQQGTLIGIQNRNLDYKKYVEVTHVKDSAQPSSASVAVPHVKDSSQPTSASSAVCSAVRSAVCSAVRFRFPPGSCCSIYNLPVLALLRENEPLFITEGCSDCWAMLSAGHKAIAIPSATLLKTSDIAILTALSTRLSTTFHMYPDRDEPGERLFLQLQQHLPGLVHHQLPAGCKDFSEYYLSR